MNKRWIPLFVTLLSGLICVLLFRNKKAGNKDGFVQYKSISAICEKSECENVESRVGRSSAKQNAVADGQRHDGTECHEEVKDEDNENERGSSKRSGFRVFCGYCVLVVCVIVVLLIFVPPLLRGVNCLDVYNKLNLSRVDTDNQRAVFFIVAAISTMFGVWLIDESVSFHLHKIIMLSYCALMVLVAIASIVFYIVDNNDDKNTYFSVFIITLVLAFLSGWSVYLSGHRVGEII